MFTILDKNGQYHNHFATFEMAKKFLDSSEIEDGKILRIDMYAIIGLLSSKEEMISKVCFLLEKDPDYDLVMRTLDEVYSTIVSVQNVLYWHRNEIGHTRADNILLVIDRARHDRRLKDYPFYQLRLKGIKTSISELISYIKEKK